MSNKGHVLVGGHPAPVVGRVSMDLMTVDVTDVPDHLSSAGNWAELIGPDLTIDMIASRADMIPYELLTGLGARFKKRYTHGDDAS